jgi:hypothetical protein
VKSTNDVAKLTGVTLNQLQQTLDPSNQACNSPDSTTAGPPKSLSFCILCHENGADAEAPKIIFSDKRKLIDEINADPAFPHGSLKDEVLFRLGTESESKMPKNIDINSTDRAELIRYFISLQ